MVANYSQPKTNLRITDKNLKNKKSNQSINVMEYGVVGDGITDDTANIQRAILAAAFKQKIISFPPGNYLVDNVDFTVHKPAGIDAQWATFIARIPTSNPLISLENTHSTYSSFLCQIGKIDCDGKAQHGLKIRGGQNMTVSASVENATSHGVLLEADVGYGIYYSSFNFDSHYNAGDGIRLETLDPFIRVAANNFSGSCNHNLGHGWYSSYAQNTYIGCTSEKNNGYGFFIGYSNSNDFIGGYSENNHKNLAQGGVSDGSADESFFIDATAVRTKILGGRHIGAVIGNTTGPGKLILPSTANYDGFSLDGNSDLKIGGSLHVQGVQAGIYANNGDPEGIVTAVAGSLCLNTAGGTNTTLYVKASGTGNTGWVAK